jgi:hypothetical protein
MAEHKRSEAAKRAWTPERRAAFAERMKGPGNPFWKGGRSIASNGYVLIKVGVGHPLADVRGYAYEHRLVASEKLGRTLEAGEIGHHDDEVKTNNEPANIEPLTRAQHGVRHRKHDRGLRNPGEPNPLIACACGCGQEFEKFDGDSRPRRFISGHNGTRNHRGQWEGSRG